MPQDKAKNVGQLKQIEQQKDYLVAGVKLVIKDIRNLAHA